VSVRLYVFDAGGRLVQTLVDTHLGAGSHTAVWDGRDRSGNRVGSGIYFYRLEAGSFVESRKMVLVK
jgi:flagellar hook assembly protein FlgD